VDSVLEAEAIRVEKNWEKRFQSFQHMFNFEENIHDSERHLDFGCCFGTFAKILAERCPNVQVYGIDSDIEKIQIGNKRYNLPNLHLMHLDKITGKYDSITSFFVLHEIPDVKGTLIDLYEHLEKDGRIMIYEFRRTGKVKYREWFVKGRPGRSFEEEYRKHNRWSVKEFGQICKDVGFKTSDLRTIGERWLLYIGKK
jgi:2-polyprenyl-3-methyl-5-hydroxy-6-metoxy-1,4-benzoquinol methylase